MVNRTWLSVALLGSLTLNAGTSTAAQQIISNDKQLGAALKTAKTADDHRRIAAYYQEKARNLQSKEKEERDMANYFATHPSLYGKLYPTPYQNHKWLAESYHREAAEALQKASQHEETAESLESKSH